MKAELEQKRETFPKTTKSWSFTNATDFWGVPLSFWQVKQDLRTGGECADTRAG
jgi:hypothetical protein